MKRLLLNCLLASALLFPAPVFAAQPSHVDASFERCKDICRDVEKIRGLSFKQEVGVDVQSLADFRAKIEKELTRQFGDSGLSGYIRALVKLGAIDQQVDFNKAIMSFMESQAVAHYDPEQQKYHLIMTNIPASLLDPVSSHELCHALQDQNFDLELFLFDFEEQSKGNRDAVTARQCLVEGEATLVIIIWSLMRDMTVADPAEVQWLATASVKLEAAMDVDTMLGMVESHSDKLGEGAKEMIASAKQVTTLPSYFVDSFMAVYFQGAMMVDHVRAAGGWQTVNTLYANPPVSTEQVLHPDKLIGKKDEPVDVKLADLADRLPKGWQLIDFDVVGELGIRVLMDVWGGSNAMERTASISAAAGWDGDRYYYFENDETDKDLLVWKTVWDTPDEAAEFTVAYRMLLSHRFPDMREAWRSGRGNNAAYQVWEIIPGRFLKLTRKGDTVGIVDTTDKHTTRVMWE